MTDDVLRLEALSVALPRGRRVVPVLDALDLAVPAGEMLALVGESGCGQDRWTRWTSMRLGLVPGRRARRPRPAGRAASGSKASELVAPGQARDAGAACADRDIGMIFQEPMTSLNPALTVGEQIGEVLMQHRGTDADRRTATVTRARRIARPRAACPTRPTGVVADYPHRLSGGMRQRVMIAIAHRLRAPAADRRRTDHRAGCDWCSAPGVGIAGYRMRRQRFGMGDPARSRTISSVVAETRGAGWHVMYAGRKRRVRRRRCVVVRPAPQHPYTRRAAGREPGDRAGGSPDEPAAGCD